MDKTSELLITRTFNFKMRHGAMRNQAGFSSSWGECLGRLDDFLRAMQAMLQMKKLVITDLQRAVDAA